MGHGTGSIPRAIAFGLRLTTLALTVVALASQPARADGSRLLELAFIGFGAAFLENAIESDTCRTVGEVATGAAIEGMAGTAGALLGAMYGAGDGGGTGSVLGGAAIGGIVGRIAGGALAQATVSEAGRLGAQARERSGRDFSDEFEFNACKIIQASNVIRTPLVGRYLEVGNRDCLPRSSMDEGSMSADDWDRFIGCNNNSNADAREITLHIIRLNQAVCRSIEELGASLVRQQARAPRDGQSVIPFGTGFDPECNYSQPADVWRHFIQERR